MVARGVDPDGALVIESAGQRTRVHSGDVSGVTLATTLLVDLGNTRVKWAWPSRARSPRSTPHRTRVGDRPLAS
jgi:hypothetical protein